MGKWQRRIIFVLSAVAVVGGAGYYWFFVDSSPPSHGAYTINMAQVRRLADSIPGAKVTEIHDEHVADYSFPATAVLAGDGWAKVDIPIQSYQLVFPDHTAIIDTGLDRKLAKDAAAFNQDAYDRVMGAMDRASLILVTHEHFDHMGGLARHPHFEKILGATRLTKEQVESPYLRPAMLQTEAMHGYKPLVYERYYAVAPGMVLIKAP